MQVRQLGPGDEDVLRTIRLTALATDPGAFGSTLVREEGFDTDDWARRIGPPGVTVVVVPGPGDAPVAMAWGVPDESDPGLVHLFGMWVGPTARGTGAADALVEAVVGWAAARGASRVELTVVDGNGAAERLYRRHGFRPTGAGRVGHDGQRESDLARSLTAPTGGWDDALRRLGLGPALGLPVPVTAGHLHRVWRVRTAAGVVAVKEVADGGHPGWAADTARAAALEEAAWRAGTVPMAEPLGRSDGPTGVLRAHRWVDGLAGVDVPPTAERLHRLGRTVAAIVALDQRAGTTADALPTNAVDAYDGTVAEAHGVGAPFADSLREIGPEVARVRADLAVLAAQRRPMVMGHGDLHARNTVVVDGTDVLLDWDGAGPVLPASELLDAAIGFGGDDETLVRAAIDGWTAAGGERLDLTGALAPIANLLLRGTLFHAWRALGHRGVDAEGRAASAALVPDLAATFLATAPVLRTWEQRLELG